MKISFARSDLLSIQKCVRCGICRSICPVFEELGWESSSARGRMLVMKRIAEEGNVYSEDLDSLNTCTTCGICTENCPAAVKAPLIIEEARRVLVSSGLMTNKQIMLNENVNFTGNVFGESSGRRGWLSHKDGLPKKADFVYFAGCLASYRYPKTTSKTFGILRRFGVTLLQDEKCCGSPLIRTGFDASELMKSNLRNIRETGAKTVITGCAGCYTTLKDNYPEEFEVVSVAEFLAGHISDVDLKPLDLTTTYHDPCHMGRQHKIFDEPRKVIKAICELEEMKSSRSSSRCCGGGGGVRSGYKELSLGMARRRLLDAPQGVDYIVTTFPLCIRNLNDAGGNGRVIDLTELVSRAIEWL